MQKHTVTSSRLNLIFYKCSSMALKQTRTDTVILHALVDLQQATSILTETLFAHAITVTLTSPNSVHATADSTLIKQFMKAKTCQKFPNEDLLKNKNEHMEPQLLNKHPRKVPRKNPMFLLQ